MEFHNLTPFEALAYSAVNVHDEEHHVVALKVAYRLVPGGEGTTHRCEAVLDDEALRALAFEDAYDGEANASSVRSESDIAPFKPRCDVLVRATAWAPRGVAAARWSVRLRVTAPHGVLVDKALDVCGPRRFERDLAGAWRLTDPTPAVSVPLRWERAFGGRSVVDDRDTPGEKILNEVCFSNPVGAGWVEARHFEAHARATGASLEVLPAPQVERADARVTGLVVAQHPPHAVEAPAMAALAAEYGQRPEGLGCVGRAWTPRLQRAGTYDEAWVRDRHPFLPDDFSFAYWNAAPDDQQIAYPPMGLRVELTNLAAPDVARDGVVSFALPPHRAFAMAWLGGLPVPMPAVIDTLTVDAEAMTVTCVWRVLIARALGVGRLEARFEVDPAAPLLKLEVGADG